MARAPVHRSGEMEMFVRVVSALLEQGVLTSESNRAHPRLAFPATPLDDGIVSGEDGLTSFDRISSNRVAQLIRPENQG